MNKQLISQNLIHAFLAFYLSIWFNGFIPPLLKVKAFDYTTVGVFAAVTMFFVAILLISNLNLSKIIQMIVIILTMVLSGFILFDPSVWTLLILAVLQGLLIGTIIKYAILKKILKNTLSYWSLGLLMSYFTFLLPSEYTYKPISSEVVLNYGLLIILILVFIILIGLTLKNNSNDFTIDQTAASEQPKTFLLLGYFITALLVVIEISFFFWSLVLKDQSQGWLLQITLPLTLVLIFVIRLLFLGKMVKLLNIGWLFFISTLLTLCIGYFYTFQFTLVFIIFFSFAIAIGTFISSKIFNQVWHTKNIGYLMIINAFIMVVAGLYIQNHIEYIESIKMPEHVFHLSARQAWIKELATIAGLVMLASGIVFLNRRRWLSGVSVAIGITILSMTSCKNSATNPKLFAVITQYEELKDQLDSLRSGPWEIETDTIRNLKLTGYLGLIAQIMALDTLTMTMDDFINKDLLLLEMENELNDISFKSHLIPLNSEGGFLTNIVYYIQYASPKSKEDSIQYLQKLQDLPRLIQYNQKLMEEGIKEGKTSPAIITQRCIDLTAPFQNIDINDNIFIAPLAANDSLFQLAKTLVKKEIEPAYLSFAIFLKDTYLPASPAIPGISHLKSGKKYYEDKVKYFTTLAMTPNQVYETGEKEVARIKAEMETIIKSLDFKGSFTDFITYLRQDPQFYAKTPRELLYRATWLSKKIEGKLPKYFNKLPRMPFTVEEVSPSIAPNYTSGRYSEGNYETGKPGAYWVNTYKLESRPLYALPALTLHEAVPGHHLQIMLSREMENVPEFRQNLYISAFGEGWGLYSEYLGKEAGMYETPYEDFGKLTYEMWRACRLVVDVGLHYKGWTREQAVDFMASNTALSMHEVNTEIDRYIGWPGQAVSYKIGEIKIRQLRQMAEAKLGDKFDIKTFHDMLLANGSVRLNTLERIVNQFITQSLPIKN